MTGNPFRLLVMALALVLPATTAARAQEAPSPPLAVIADADTTVYLFGAVNTVRRGVAWSRPEIEQALAGSDSVWVETRSDDDPAGLLMVRGFSDTRSLWEVLSPRTAADLRALVGGALDDAILGRMKPWLAGLVSIGFVLDEAGYVSAPLIPRELEAMALGRGIPVHSLETAAEQVDLLDSIDHASAIGHLEWITRDPDGYVGALDAGVADWLSGDPEAAVLREVRGMQQCCPDMLAKLTLARSARLADRVESLLEQPGEHFIVASLLTVHGERGALAILISRGHVIGVL
jgi:uncharacterized protein YbaP (TraB family)